MSIQTLVTAEQLWEMPSLEGRRELVRGNVIETSPVTWLHGVVSSRVAHALREFADQQVLGEVAIGDVGYFIERHPDTVRAPDVSFVKPGRLPAQVQRGFLDLAPDLAVEVLSVGDRPSAVQATIGDWLSAGTPLVWLVDPYRRTVAVYDAEGGVRTLAEGETLDGGDVLPGFSCPVARFFPPERGGA